MGDEQQPPLPVRHRRKIEVLSAWYLRFHGYLTAPHFVLHQPNGKQYTDADILGVRFPHSSEDVVSGGADPALDVRADLVDIVVAECSASTPKINDPWRDDFERHLQYVLRYLGVWPSEELSAIAKQVERAEGFCYEWQGLSGLRFRIRFVLFARSLRIADDRLRPLRTIRLLDMLNYLGNRFGCYSTLDRPIRSAHSQWDPFIKDLYDRLMPAGDAESRAQVLAWILEQSEPEEPGEP